MDPADMNLGWRKSSNSGAQCVEVGGVPWRKSSYSSNGGADCVEAGHTPGVVLIRDTKNHGHGPVLRVPPAAWQAFTTTLRASATLS
jgi:hypothetical protein